MAKVRASVAGASGYAGGELARWLMQHPAVELMHVTAFREQGRPLADVFPNLRGFGDHTLNGAGWAEISDAASAVCSDESAVLLAKNSAAPGRFERCPNSV